MAADGYQGAVDLSPGKVLLGRYEVLRTLGRGAMGEVLEVRDRQSETHYALKRVPPEVARQRGQMQAIRANFKLVSGLTHPHIAVTRFLETDEQTGDIFVLMDLIRGRDLHAWTVDQRQALGDSEAPLPMPVVLGIAEQIAAALDYAHAQPAGMAADGTIKRYGILHRDLKPENVMVEDARQYRAGVPYVKLVDFGLAAEIQTSLKSQTQNVTGVNPASGTPLYMAPEQWEGRRLSRAIDQWALAVLTYELLEGRPPFHGVSITDLREQVLKGRPVQPEQMTPPQWNALQVSLRADRGQRYRCCIALVKALAEADQITRGTLQVVELPLPDETPGSQSPAPLTGTLIPPTDSSLVDSVVSGKALAAGGVAPQVSSSLVDTNSKSGTDTGEGDEARLRPTRDKRPAKAAGRRRVSRWPRVALAFCVVAAAAAIVLQLQTRQGTLIVEVDQPGARVSIDDQERGTIEQPGQATPLQVIPQATGHELKIVKDGFEVYTQHFAIKSGTKETVRVRLVPLKKPEPPPVEPPPVTIAKPAPEPAKPLPLVVAKHDPLSVMAGEEISFQAQASDPNRPMGTLAYELTAPVPAGAKIDARSGQVTWTPALDAIGGLQKLTIRIASSTPGVDASSLEVLVQVQRRPESPRIGRLAEQSVEAGQTLKFQILAVDPNTPPGELRYELLPPITTGALLDAATGAFTWPAPTSLEGQTTRFRVRVTSATPQAPSAESEFAVRITSPPKHEPPRLADLAEQRVEAGRPVTVQVVALDPNRPQSELRYDLGASAPDGAKIDPRSGQFQWTPPRDYRLGKASVPLRVTTADARTPAATKILMIDVLRPSPAANDFAGTQAGQVREDNGLKMKLCWCPPGTFTMGSPKSEPDRDDDEDQVQVTLSNGFWLGKHEVTQSEWQSVMETTVAQQRAKTSFTTMAGEGPTLPIYYVSHEEATEFCAKLTARDRQAGRLPAGWEYRLPTEAQWEYACRAGKPGTYSFGNTSAKLGEYAWFSDDSKRESRPVGEKKANDFGLCDMHGNVWEWCWDWYQAKLPGGTEPEVSQQAGSRVVRGGSWGYSAAYCRSAGRRSGAPSGRFTNLGFRLAAVQHGAK